MNTICSVKCKAGLWRVVARSPCGILLVVSLPSREEAIRKARWAEPEPA